MTMNTHRPKAVRHDTVPSFSIAMLAAAISVIILIAFLIGFFTTSKAHAHDIWINEGHYRNPAGEWCCGTGDCGVVGADGIHAIKGGYSINSRVVYGSSITGNAADGSTTSEPIKEFVPYSQALPSPDGEYWRCKRPDGTPRCFFAPKLDY